MQAEYLESENFEYTLNTIRTETYVYVTHFVASYEEMKPFIILGCEENFCMVNLKRSEKKSFNKMKKVCIFRKFQLLDIYLPRRDFMN